MPSAPPPLKAPAALAVQGLSVSFAGEHRRLQVLTDVTFELRPSETLGIIGESGSGKSTLALAAMAILPPAAHIDAGRVALFGRDLQGLPQREMNRVRGGQLAMIFQEPMTSLDPAFTMGEQIAEVYRAHVRTSQRAAQERAVEMLALVGIPEPRRRATHYPHQFSGGMRQRALIAMALVCEPRVLLADEPTTAVDVTTQAQILDLLKDLASRFHPRCPLAMPVCREHAPQMRNLGDGRSVACHLHDVKPAGWNQSVLDLLDQELAKQPA